MHKTTIAFRHLFAAALVFFVGSSFFIVVDPYIAIIASAFVAGLLSPITIEVEQR